MPNLEVMEPDAELPPPGRRWGSGAHSVLPYLARSLQAKPLTGADAREPKPHPAHSRSGERSAASS
jgi:hypothetical protein